MGDPRVGVTEAIAALIESNRQLRSRLQLQERLLKSALMRIGNGESIAGTMIAIPTVDDREQSEDAVRLFYARRSDVREAVVEAALDEGLTVAEVASAFGIHHEQVAAHVAKHAALIDPRR
jgi:hypothetical protein